jgi:hypothetical protein
MLAMRFFYRWISTRSAKVKFAKSKELSKFLRKSRIYRIGSTTFFRFSMISSELFMIINLVRYLRCRSPNSNFWNLFSSSVRIFRL